MKLDWQSAIDKIEGLDDIVIATHVMPDGDGLGSMLALTHYLRRTGKTVYPTWGGTPNVPEAYRFLPEADTIVDPADVCKEGHLFIAVDCATLDRLGTLKKCYENAASVINIDHHRDNERYGEIDLIYGGASSCCELVFELIELLCGRSGLSVDKDEALCLYTGVVTDTGRFQYSSTNPDTFRVASDLLKRGVDPSYIFRNVYENTSAGRLRLAGTAYARTAIEPDVGLAWTYITKKDFSDTSTTPEDSEDIINALRAVKDIDVALIVKETGGGKRASLRSTGVIDVATIAEDFGGGGHTLAAGFTSSDTVEAIVERVKELIREQKAGS